MRHFRSSRTRLPIKAQVSAIYHEYPSQFWILVFGTFIDRLGGALLFPFFTLYITRKFSVGMTQVGFIFMLFSVSSVTGSMVGGALTDRLGRKGMLIFGLAMSATSSLLMGVVNQIEWFMLVSVLVGVLANAGGPAQQAMVADLLPENKRAQGFGILRVVVNLSVTIGPMIGGLLATQSYLLLFICDAVASLITAAIVYFALKETRAPQPEDHAPETMLQTFRGYFKVLQDNVFIWFLFASMLMVIVYMQMNTTMAVYLRDVHGLTEQHFGYILSLNAAMVVLFQFPITRWITPFRPLNVIAVGTLFYAVGFAMYGFVNQYALFLLAMAIITIGEMLISPVGQAIVARLAPEAMRGRYMAVFGFSWVLPSAVGPLLAGLVMDNLNPNWVWYASGILGLIAAGAFYGLELRAGQKWWSAVTRRLRIIEQLEEGEISAVQAASLLDGVSPGNWGKLAPTDGQQPSEVSRRYLRIQVSDLATGAMKADLQLPVGLVNTVLYTEGKLDASLEDVDTLKLRELLARASSQGSADSLEMDGERRINVSLGNGKEQ